MITNQRPARSEAGRLRGHAFTLTEMLVVVAVIGILAAMLVPVLAKAKVRAQGMHCLSNNRQLALAWSLYADDHDGKLVPNQPGSVDSWAPNVLTYDSSPDNTNAFKLVDPRYSRFAPYVSSPGVYKCPGDQSAIWRWGTPSRRVRSMAMNFAVGLQSGSGNLPFGSGYRVYRKSADIVDPSPSNLWLFMDEHPDSIDDGAFVVDCDHQGPTARIISFPANYHNGAASVAFTDGHAEMRQWKDERTRYPNKYCGCLSHYAANGLFTDTPDNPDIAWLQERTSARIASR